MSSLLEGQPGESTRTRCCRASGKAVDRAVRGGGALTPDSNPGSRTRSCGQAQSRDVVSPTDSAKTAFGDADIGQWSGRTRTSPRRGAVTTFSSWPAAGSPAPTGAGLEDLECAEGLPVGHLHRLARDRTFMRLAATKDTHIGQRIGARSRNPDMIEQVAGLCCAAADVRLAIADATHRHSRRDVRRPRPTCFSTAITRTLSRVFTNDRIRGWSVPQKRYDLPADP